MADKKNVPPADPQQAPALATPAAAIAAQSVIAAEQAAIAAAQQEAREKRLDETTPGGRYKVNGLWVDADGKPHKDQESE